MLGAKKKVQVRIQARVPFLPAVLPVGSGEIASIVAKNFYGLGAIPLSLRIKNEFRLAGRRESGVLGGRRSRLGTLIHGEMGEAQGRPTRLPAWRNHWVRRRPTTQENAFGWDCNQTGICDEPQSETGENLLVGERAVGCVPET